MGTRAFVEFPTYEFWAEFEMPLHYIFGKETGSIYVYVGYDGDTLPTDLHVAIHSLMKRDNNLAMLDPQRVAAELVRVLFDDGGDTIRVYANKPDEGFHLVCDFKKQTITYVDRDTFDLKQWVSREWAPVFTYDEEDVEDLTAATE